jgi:hypothetical protein
VSWPVVKRGRVEIRAVGPHKRLNLRINSHLLESREIFQWSEEFPNPNRPKVDCLFAAVVELDAQRVWSLDRKTADAMDRMPVHYEWLLGCFVLICSGGVAGQTRQVIP